ncbi:MoaD/ThiS family protein [Altererythrobacter sp. BO-6]|uniref:MoaD/ThiS family protein n=1 Tax=Altererythrobacter sp. BO-6 TaxID=2604537 RepID=UPI0013E16C89|nr:MoaD/ThiS family protein [Altererythrobacter sp. BO-6]QIG53318.1 MoaD/ThiS family protein [Altererythrobacter sp. BO-6]
MSVRVLYLGKLADVAGTAESEFFSSSGELDWPDLLALLHDQVNPDIAKAAEDRRTLIAINGKVLSDRTCLEAKHGDEVALLPPVSGG